MVYNGHESVGTGDLVSVSAYSDSVIGIEEEKTTTRLW